MFIDRRFNGDYIVAVDNDVFIYPTIRIVNYLFAMGYSKVTDKDIREWLTKTFDK